MTCRCPAIRTVQMESWPRILGFLPRSLKGFFLNQFREEASEAQLEQLSSVIYKHVGGVVPLTRAPRPAQRPSV